MQTRRDDVGHRHEAGGLDGLGRLAAARGASRVEQGGLRGQEPGRCGEGPRRQAPIESKDVTLTGPDIAENGAVVPVGASTLADGRQALAILVEKNPNALAALFDVTDAVEAELSSTRVKMGQSSERLCRGVKADGKVLFAQKEIKVTLGGCGG